MTLVQLQHFLTLARVGSFVGAAEALHLTQPALSRSIKALEEELGQSLFDRIGRRIALTPFGHDMRGRVQLLLEDVQELKNAGRQMASGDRGRFRLGLGSGPSALFATRLLTHMARDFPHFHLEISRGNTDTLVHQLRERELDALIVDARSLKWAPDLSLSQLSESEGGFMCRPGHPLLAGPPASFDALLRYPIASTPLSDEVARMLVEHFGERAHPQTMMTLSSDEISHLVETAQQTDAIVFAVFSAAPSLVALPMADPLRSSARFGLVTVASRAQSIFLPEIQRFMQQSV